MNYIIATTDKVIINTLEEFNEYKAKGYIHTFEDICGWLQVAKAKGRRLLGTAPKIELSRLVVKELGMATGKQFYNEIEIFEHLLTTGDITITFGDAGGVYDGSYTSSLMVKRTLDDNIDIVECLKLLKRSKSIKSIVTGTSDLPYINRAEGTQNVTIDGVEITGFIKKYGNDYKKKYISHTEKLLQKEYHVKFKIGDKALYCNIIKEALEDTIKGIVHDYDLETI